MHTKGKGQYKARRLANSSPASLMAAANIYMAPLCQGVKLSAAWVFGFFAPV
jgi:hypothetical protein